MIVLFSSCFNFFVLFNFRNMKLSKFSSLRLRTSHRNFCSLKYYENKSGRDDFEYKNRRNRLSKKLIDGKQHKKLSPLPILNKNNEFNDIRNKINNECKNISEIYRILQSPLAKKNNYDHTVYVCSMKKGELISKDYRFSESIMKLIYDNDIDRNIIVYNEFFKILTKYGKIQIAMKYLNHMIKIDKINPTIITATILIGACKETSDYLLATKIWNIIIKKYNLLPDCICYTQLISVYTKACKIKLAQYTFNEMLNNNILPNLTCYSSLINGYLKCNQLENAIKLFKFIHLNQTTKYQITQAQYIPFISYYLKKNKPFKALKIYDQCIKLMMNKPYLLKNDETLQYVRSVIYVQLIKQGLNDNNDNNDKDIKEWFHILFQVIPFERESIFNLSRSNHRLSHLQLQVMLLLKDENKIIEFFENDLLKSSSFGMWKFVKDNEINNWCIDLHLMTFEVAQFILKYIFKYQKQNILNCINNNNSLYILCGKNNHRIIRDNKEGKDVENNIKKCVIDLVSKWKPTINIEMKQDDEAFIIMDATQIINFYKLNGDKSLCITE